MLRQCEARIDLNAIRANCDVARKIAPKSQLIAVIKADGYGHGCVQVARALDKAVDALAVAILDEAIELREAGITTRMLVLEGVSDASGLACAAQSALDIVIHHKDQVAALESASLSRPVTVWLKVDTGMHRLGIAPGDVHAMVDRLVASPNCDDRIVLCTHLACADEPDHPSIRAQLTAFDDCVSGLALEQSICNSAGLLGVARSRRDWNRPGYMLYGNSPFAGETPASRGLRPAMTLSSEIIALRDIAAGDAVGYGGRWVASKPSRIATVAAGYADGYPRHAPNGTPALVNGQMAQLVGTVSMDMLTLDVTALGDVSIGDAVVLWGEGLAVDEIARRSGTIGYELLTGVTRRVPRRFIGE